VKELTQTIKGNIYGFAVLLLALSVLLPSIAALQTSAAQITTRSIQMSDATPAHAATTYKVTFTAGSSYNLQGMVVDFCDDSPIIGSSSCTGTAGTEVPNFTGTSVSAVTGAGTGTWTPSTLNSGRTVTLSNSSTNNVTSSTTISFDVTATNPSDTDGGAGTAGTFYARIYTFASNTSPAGYTVAAPGTYVDYGGIALSTTNAIAISATVQETLTFCVSGTTIPSTNGCGSATSASIVLGAGTPPTISFDQIYTKSVYSQISSNGSNGSVVRIKGASTDLISGSNSIARVGNDTTAASIPATATGGATSGGGFGAQLATGATTFGSFGAVQAPFNGTSNSYGMHSGVSGTYGATLVSASGAIVDGNMTLTFGAAAGTATPAGIYQANYSLIATSTY
jgi:hypothetical protein